MATEKRLIDANALTDEVDNSRHNNPHPPGLVRVNHRNEHSHFIRMILDAPTVDAVEVVHGKWIRRHNETKCSKCKFIYYSNHDDFNYCPNCGAKMDGGAEDG